MKSVSRLVVIPIEVTARDFYPRLFLACKAVHSGFKVVFGMQGPIVSRIEKIPRGIYFDNSLSTNKAIFQRRLKRLGFQVASIDEESLASSAFPKNFLQKRYSAESFDAVDLCFVWGQKEYQLIGQKFGTYLGKVVVSGSPRVDILHKANRQFFINQAREICDSVGDYVLFLSNFTVHHALGNKGRFDLLRKLGRYSTHEERKYYEGRTYQQTQYFARFEALVEAAARTLPSQLFVIRPHPSEDRTVWDDLAKKVDNLIVCTSGSAIPWMLGAKAGLHSGCTTGIEAFFLDVPTISYLPRESVNAIDRHVANDASVVVDSIEEAVAILTKVLDTDQARELSYRSAQRVRAYIENFDQPTATGTIIEKLLGLPTLHTNLSIWTTGNIVGRDLKDFAMNYVRELFDRKRTSKKVIQERQYGSQKRGDFSRSKIVHFVDWFNRAYGEDHRPIKVRLLGKDLSILRD